MTNQVLPSMNKETPDLLDMVTRFYQSVFTLSPEELVPQILIEAAKVFKADIATWFLVTEDRTQLRLVDVYNDRGERTQRPEMEPYKLNWEASVESEVRGLTAWIAISGIPLFVPSSDSLLNEHQVTHIGKWDNWLYPEGINDPTSGFLCLYAVPLFLPIESRVVRDRIVGVLKVERRRHRNIAFTEEERKAFDVIANIMGFAYSHSERQKSLTLVDIGHTLIRPLGDATVTLDSVEQWLREDQSYEKKQLNAVSKQLRSLSTMLRIAKDSFNDPTGTTTVSLREMLGPQLDDFSLLSGRQVHYLSTDDFRITITKRALAALFNIMVNLVDNAIRYSNSSVGIRYSAQDKYIILRVESEGSEIPGHILDTARYAESGADIFKGLPRSYQLATRNGWELQYLRERNKNSFEVKISVPFVKEVWVEQ